MTLTSLELIGVVLSLVSAILFLFRKNEARHDKTDAKLDQCQEDHKARDVEMRELHGRVERIEGEREGHLLAVKEMKKDTVEQVSELLISAIQSEQNKK